MSRSGTRVRAVLFDLGGTLVDECDYTGWCELARRCYLDLEPDDLSHAYPEVAAEMDAEDHGLAGDPLRLEFWRRTLSRAAGRELSGELARRFVAAVRASHPAYPLFSDARRCLDALRAEHRALGVVSNSSSEAHVREILHRAGILDYFERVVSSGTEGVEKPDGEIFRRAIDRLRVRPAEALYVGNLAHTDARAARSAGLHALWLNRSGFGYGEDPPEITSLLEVPLWVARIERGP